MTSYQEIQLNSYQVTSYQEIRLNSYQVTKLPGRKCMKESDIKNYRGLLVYQKANALVIAIYRITKTYPKEELFGLVSQMRRSAVSVTGNIVEGYGRKTQKDKLHFCFISRGSLAELEYYIDLSQALGYIKKKEYDTLIEMKCEVGKILQGYITFLNK